MDTEGSLDLSLWDYAPIQRGFTALEGAKTPAGDHLFPNGRGDLPMKMGRLCEA
jgi:hypothetical protein